MRVYNQHRPSGEREKTEKRDRDMMVEKALARVVICRLESADLKTIRVFG